MKNIKAFAKRNGFSYIELFTEGKPVGIVIETQECDENGLNAHPDWIKYKRIVKYCIRTGRRWEGRAQYEAIAVYAGESV